MLPEYFALNLIRLDNDWSYQTLAKKMAEGEAPIAWRTLHYLLTHDDSGERARDRTLHKVRKFLRYAKAQRWTTFESRGAHADAPELRSHDVTRPRRRKHDAPLRAQPVPRG